jgi:ATP-binding cassette, subfamily F, member 3
VLECDVERRQLLEEEQELLSLVNPAPPQSGLEGAGHSSATDDASGKIGGAAVDAASLRLQEVYTRLQDIDADGAPARAACILAGLSFDEPMQKRATKTFSGGAGHNRGLV